MDEIVNGERDATLNFVWLLAALGSIAPNLPTPPPTDSSLAALTNNVAGQLVAWCRRRAAAMPMILIKDLGAQSFGDGMALCAIVNAVDPEQLSLEEIVPGCVCVSSRVI